MLKRHSLAVPLLLSVIIHALVIAGGEKLSPSAGKSEESPSVAVNYQPPPPSGEKNTEEVGKGGKETPSVATTLSLETSDPLYRPYFKTVRRKIGDRWKDPRGKGDERKKGKVLLEFTVTSAGKLQSVEVAESSGEKSYDFSAVKAVKGASPFEPFPTSISKRKLTIKALFVYD